GIAGAGRWVGAEVGRKQDCVIPPPCAASLVRDETAAIVGEHTGVEHVEATAPGQLEVESAVRLVIAQVLARPGVEDIGGLSDRLAILEADRRHDAVDDEVIVESNHVRERTHRLRWKLRRGSTDAWPELSEIGVQIALEAERQDGGARRN